MLKRAKIAINFDTDEAIIPDKKLTLEKCLIIQYVLPLIPNYQEGRARCLFKNLCLFNKLIPRQRTKDCVH